MKLKVGDKVLLKKKVNQYCNLSMKSLLGKIITVQHLNTDGFYCKNWWYWSNGVIEKIIKIQYKLK